MTTEEARQKVRERLAVVRSMRDVARGETCVLEALHEALIVGHCNNDNLAIILDVLQEDES